MGDASESQQYVSATPPQPPQPPPPAQKNNVIRIAWHARIHTCSPNSVSTLRGSYGKRKGIEVAALAASVLRGIYRSFVLLLDVATSGRERFAYLPQIRALA